MELIFYKDLIIKFISQKIETEEHQKLINKIFDNENSVFLHSKKFFQFIAEELGEEFENEFRAIATKIGDNGLSVKSSDETRTFDEEFLHVYQSSNKNVTVSISYSEPSQLILQKIPNIAVISNCKKPNYHWLVTQIAVLHPNKVTVNCFDFANDNQIKQFFDDIFSIPKQMPRMYIFDRYKLFNHNRFNHIKDTHQVNYYTLYNRDFHLDEPLIRGFFRRVRVYTTTNRRIAHSRKIIFDRMVVISDNGFDNLECGGDWNIDVQYNPTDAQNWLSRCNNRNYRDCG